MFYDGVSHRNIVKSYQFINKIIKQFVIQYQIQINPCYGITIPQNNAPSELKFYNKEQIEKIENEAIRKYSTGKSIYRLGWAAILLLYMGLRLGELLALTWDDIIDTGIKVNKNVVNIKGKMILQTSTKTYSSTRLVPYNEKSKRALNELRQITGENKFVISTSNGGYYCSRNFDRMLNNIEVACNVPKYSAHAYRHTFASMLFSNGCDVQIVSFILGHSDTTITRNIYIHILDEQRQKAMDSIDKHI